MAKPTIQFRDKATSKQEQERAFLALPPSERFAVFLQLCEYYAQFESHLEAEKNDNWVLEWKRNDVR